MDTPNASGENIFREVSAKSDIVKVVAFYLGQKALVRKGKIYLTICPFHHDTHPSMRVDPSRNMFKCFACGTGGDSISFVEKYAHLEPMEALKKVCEICSIPIPSSIHNAHAAVNPAYVQYAKELSALTDLKKFYQLTLSSVDGKPGKDYLDGRKIPEDIREHFGIGFAPADDTLAIASLRKLGYEIPTLEKAGILANSSELRDHYASRIMFPIEDNSGKTVAFSGRQIEKTQPGGKYINYLDTPLFHKSEILYHFAQAKETARKDGFLYLMEGFMDVIATVRAGINSIVGTMGTALTEEHLKALASLKVTVRLCLDSDEPGQLGEERALPLLRKAGIPFEVVRPFKGGKDADEILTKLGKDALLSSLKNLYDPFLFLLGRALKGRKQLLDTLEVETFLKVSAPYYFALDPIGKSKDLSILAKITTLKEETLGKILLGYQNEKKPTPGTPSSDFRKPARPLTPTKTTLQSNLPESANLSDPIVKLYQKAQQRPESESLLADKLLFAETQIVFALAKSREAYRNYESAKTALVFHPYYTLATLFGTVYLKDLGLVLFGEKEFTHLSDVLEKSGAKEETSQSESPADSAFDLDGLEEEKPSVAIPPEEKDFLSEALPFIRNSHIPYEKDHFLKLLRYQKALVELNNFLTDIQLRKNGVRSPEDEITYASLLYRVNREKS